MSETQYMWHTPQITPKTGLFQVFTGYWWVVNPWGEIALPASTELWAYSGESRAGTENLDSSC